MSEILLLVAKAWYYSPRTAAAQLLKRNVCFKATKMALPLSRFSNITGRKNHLCFIAKYFLLFLNLNIVSYYYTD